MRHDSSTFPELQREKMTSLTIHNLGDDLEEHLRFRAAQHGRSMEEEARSILLGALAEPIAPANLARAIHARFAPLAVWYWTYRPAS